MGTHLRRDLESSQCMQESFLLAGMQIPCLKSLRASAQDTTFRLFVCDFCHIFIAHSESYNYLLQAE